MCAIFLVQMRRTRAAARAGAGSERCEGVGDTGRRGTGAKEDGVNIWPHIGISAGGVVGVVVATVVLYAVFVAILHFWGVRYLAAGSTMSVAVFTVLGALCARAMLGNSPTLCGALVAMATLFVLEFGFGRLHAVMSMRSHRAAGRARAWAVMIDGRARPDALRHVGLTAERLHERLRGGGVRHLDDVALAVLEPRGTLTVVRRGESIDPQLLVGIAGLPPGFGDVDTTGGR
ncbi:MAG TPA: DUF421 domain-containing protein [Dermacoccus sp.]|nr:DUF421 domain-containing protein [Dermacoccus sp.]